MNSNRLVLDHPFPEAVASLKAYIRVVQDSDPLSSATVVGPSIYANLVLLNHLEDWHYAHEGLDET